MKIPNIFLRIPFQKTTAALLVMMILISQTIHVDFFDRADATPENYRDIVSIIVDRDTYAIERNRIRRYASDIAGYLGGVRTSIIVTDPSTRPATIAAKNETLYYEGDGERGTSALVGTVLIGNVPIPKVEKDDKEFASLYPYVDFVDKAFVYDAPSGLYRYQGDKARSESVEVWHGVINPATGRSWSGDRDIQRIGAFLDKTHDFYTKSGKFAPNNIPPQVLYYDGENESESADARAAFQYALSMQNSENIAYNRYTKYLLTDISQALNSYDSQNADPDIMATYASFGIDPGSDTLSTEQIQKLPDIQTREVIQGFLKNFKGIFNEKSLGDQLSAVHNAGRYNSGTTVRADLLPISITLMDQIAQSTLRTSNQALAAAIDTKLKSTIASRILIHDQTISSYSGNTTVGIPNNNISYKKEYKNYYFGTLAQTITDPSQCTIARGYSGDISQYGRSVLVEANTAFDIKSTQSQVDILKKDTDELIALQKNPAYSCFDTTTSKPKIASYWGDNSVLKISENIAGGGSPDDFLFGPSPITVFTGFSLPIMSLGGMKESARITTPSIANCIDSQYQYTLLQPYTYTYTVGYGGESDQTQTCTAGWPNEWNRPAGVCDKDIGNRTPRFTCNTTHEVGKGATITESIRDYTSRTCFAGTLWIDGKAIKKGTNTCIITIAGSGDGDGGSTVDNTIYEDRTYHTIPSVWSHSSPTDEEIMAARTNGVTPSLPIDQTRFVEFLTPQGNIARINYPNFFDIQGSDIVSARSWLRAQSESAWNNIITRENATTITPEQQQINSLVPPGVLPTSPIDWNTMISDKTIEQILQARRWLHPDISLKYRRALESLLSYSHTNTGSTALIDSAPILPSISNEYEIAYLGLPSQTGFDFSHGGSSISDAAYRARLAEIEGANISEENKNDPEGDPTQNPATQCGPPDGVPLAQWPAAIMCWIRAQFPPRILAGACGPSTIGLTAPLSVSPIAPSLVDSTDTGALTAFYTGSMLIPHMERSSMRLTDTLPITVSLSKNNIPLIVPAGTIGQLQILSGTVDGRTISSSDLIQYLTISPADTPVGEKGAQFLISSLGKSATFFLQARYSLPLPDGSSITLLSAPFQIRITPEYLLSSLEQSGSTITSIDVTRTDPVSLRIARSLKDGTSVITTGMTHIDIYDDISSVLVYSGSLRSGDPLPLDITRKTGVYRILLSDSTGVSGEMTFAVVSGPLSQIRIVPISSALVRGSRTLSMISLLDRIANPISPDLHTLRVDITGGYVVDAQGTRQTSLTLDVMDSQVPLLIGSDTAGILTMTVTTETGIVSKKEIKIYDAAQIVLSRSADPRVGGDSVGVHIEVRDPRTNQPLSGLSSVATWQIPDGAGSFSTETINITDGVSQDFSYIPGIVSGDHHISIDIPGVGSLSDMVFSLLPGDPLFISHRVDSGRIVFSLRDRYDNIASLATLTGSLIYNAEPSKDIVFDRGIMSIPEKSGYYRVVSPGLRDFAISYTDDAGPHRIPGIDTYTTHISDSADAIHFAPDYNARYTVLAGGSYLKEASDILYEQSEGQSQSLAVSTSLDTPYEQDVLFTLSPGGGYRIASSSDISLSSSVSLPSGYPLLSISDDITHRSVAQIRYQMQDATLDICQQSSTVLCHDRSISPTIRLILPMGSELTSTKTNTSIHLSQGNLALATVSRDGALLLAPGFTLAPDITSPLGLSLHLVYQGKTIARLIYMMDLSKSVIRGSTGINTPALLSSGFSLRQVSASTEFPGALGYQIYRSSDTPILDSTKNAPTDTDSIGSLSEAPGVGWTANNTMLLAYAGGDTVGESTKWFHTYSLINLGDPVAHVDHSRAGTEIDGVDRSVGSILSRSNRSGIAEYFHRDMDHDGREDILVAYQDGYIELLLNQGNRFRSRGMITYNRDIDVGQMAFGDFTHDGYGDIVGIGQSGSLILIDNADRKFVRRDIVLDSGSQLPSFVSQFKIYDMDADSRDDIVYITASGELGILYGTAQAGAFTKKILDPTLGITLSDAPIRVGGAIKMDGLKQIDTNLTASTNTGTEIDDALLKSEVYYQYRENTPGVSATSVTPDKIALTFTEIQAGTTGTRESTYIRSQYAPAEGLEITKNYTNTTHTTLYPDDRIETTIRIRNTSTRTIKNAEYLDTLPKIFSAEDTTKYKIIRGDIAVSRDFDLIGDGEYDAHFTIGNLAPGETVIISYELIALPASYGEMVVGDLEKGTVGADIHGDVGFKTSTTCGADMLLWSSGPGARDYTRGTHEFGSASLPDGIADRLSDPDNNGIPDSIEKMSLADRQKAYTDMTTMASSVGNEFIKTNTDGGQINIGFDDRSTNTLLDATQNLMDGLACGFGGGGCINFPLNWAPMAPGNPLAIFGKPVPGTSGWASPEGSPTSIPIFSALTWITTPIPIGACGYVPLWGAMPIPTVWPASPYGMPGNPLDGGSGFPFKFPQASCGAPVPSVGTMQAGGRLGTNGVTNFLRIFVTPTLTLGMGTAICMGGPAKLQGNIPPPALSPLIKGGNCIVMTKPMNVCKSDGSSADGDVSALSGLGGAGGGPVWNASSCQPQATTITQAENAALTNDIISYLNNPETTRLGNIYKSMSNRGPSNISIGPLLQIGRQASGASDTSIEIDSNTRISDIGSVIKTKNKRIAAFPDFVMDWLSRQTEEVTTSLFTPPNLTIIPPTSFGQNAQFDGGFSGITQKLSNSFSSANIENIKQAAGGAYDKTQKSPSTNGSNNLIGNGTIPVESTIKQAKGTFNALKSAYTLIGKTPFVNIQQVSVPLNIPWVDKRELDKYDRALKAYMTEIDRTMANLCINDPSVACADKKAKFQAGGFVSSIRENLRVIEEYKRFPMKIQKYLTWKERYIAQVLCNVNTVQQITGGWLRDNGMRFRKWAELFALIKAIAAGWQPMLDIFADANKSCGVCRNERNNLQYWKFKLIGSLIPQIPVLKFPKWPDIVLNLADVRFGINIAMPNYDIRISPVRLPEIPKIAFGNISALLTLGALPVIPGIPPLPDLPDLPSLPRVKLPDLPPPPKLPKIAGQIAGFLKIMKLISKMYCYYQKTTLIPEWQVGDVIAQRTERQGTMPFDFLSLNMPQFSLPTLKEIKVASHVNYSLRSDFITEFARASVKPINEFQTDLQRAIPSKIGEDISVPGVNVSKSVKPGASIQSDQTASGVLSALIDQFEKDQDIFIDTIDFRELLRSQFVEAGLYDQVRSLDHDIRLAHIEADTVIGEAIEFDNKKWELLRDYLRYENASNATLQKIINTLRTDDVPGARQLVADIGSDESVSERALKKYQDFVESHSLDPSSQALLWTDSSSSKNTILSRDDDIAGMRHALDKKLSRMIADTTTPVSPTPSPTSLASGYSPKYQGIYIRTTSGVQTRLFDYIQPIKTTTRVDTLDIDQDGDLDYIYILDGILYIKYGWFKTPNNIQDTTVKISDIGVTDPIPYIPDYFHEEISTPKNLNFSFTPSLSNETEWRMEFYDRYTEWDHVDIGTHIDASAPKALLDMFLAEPSIFSKNTGILATRVRRSLTSVTDPATWILAGRTIDVYTGALSISISPGKILYTGKDAVTLTYKNANTLTPQTVTLDPYTGYQWTDITEITTTGGRLYRIGATFESARYTYSDDLIGMPILPGMRLYSSDRGAIVRDHTQGQDIRLPDASTYLTYDLGDRSDHYEVSVGYPDGYYYARLANLTKSKTDRAGIELLAPQVASDDGAPIIEVPSRVRVPIYGYRTLSLTDLVTDMSHATIQIDGDITVDTDKNGTPDDDFATIGTGFIMNTTELKIGGYANPAIYTMQIRATDEMGNMSTSPLVVEAYTPIPQIQSLSITGTLIGTIGEPTFHTPIHIWRVRPGEGPQLISPIASWTDSLGIFQQAGFLSLGETVTLQRGAQTGYISDRGVFALSGGLHIEVAGATASDATRLFVMDNSGSISHIHTWTLPQTIRIIDTTQATTTGTGIYVSPVAGLSRMTRALASDRSLSSGVYIVDTTYRPLVGVSRDGQIYILDPLVTLVYRPRDGYLGIDIVRDDQVMASVVYRIEFFYTMK